MIEVEKINSVGVSERPLKKYGTLRKGMELILRRPLRPNLTPIYILLSWLLLRLEAILIRSVYRVGLKAVRAT